MSDPNTGDQSLDFDALMAKIQKILALAAPDSGATQPEMENATLRVQEILARYNLSMADVEAHNPAGKSPYLTRDFKLYGAVAGDRNWRRLLLDAVARNNFCRITWYVGSKWCAIVGQDHNIDVVEYLYNYLAQQIEVLAKQQNVEIRTGPKRRHWLSWRAGYCVGCVQNLDARLRQRRWATDEEMALVVVKDDELLVAMSELHPESEEAALLRKLNEAAQLRGYADAHKIALDDAVTEGGREATTSLLSAAGDPEEE